MMIGGYRRAGPQSAAHLEPVELGEHHVEHDEVERLLGEAGKGLPAVGGAYDLEAVLAQWIRQQRADRLFVVDNQNAGRPIGHGPRGNHFALKRSLRTPCDLG